jgi:hypothetical protein
MPPPGPTPSGPTSPGPTSPGPPSGRRSPYLIPLIGLSCVAALLLVAIVVVAARRADRSRAESDRAAVTGGALIDPCLVGTWRTTLDSQRLTVDGVGPVTVAGQGAVVHVRPDGTDVQDYAAATPYEGQAGEHLVRVTVTGTVRAGIRTGGGTISFHDLTTDGTVATSVDGVQRSSQRLTVGSDPVGYTCSGDTATEYTSQYNVKLVRISGTP